MAVVVAGFMVTLRRCRQQLFEMDEKLKTKEDDEVFHYISYLPINGRLYELDGLQDGPIDHGRIPDNG